MRKREISNQYMFLKEGYLYKKSDGMMGLFEVYLFLNFFSSNFLGKKKKYFMLSKSRLYCFNDERNNKCKGVFNFKIARCELTKINER